MTSSSSCLGSAVPLFSLGAEWERGRGGSEVTTCVVNSSELVTQDPHLDILLQSLLDFPHRLTALSHNLNPGQGYSQLRRVFHVFT